MAWTTVIYQCGHGGKEQMYGPGRERERKVEWIRQSKLCPECYQKQRDEQRAAEQAAAAEKAAAFKLPKLEGTEKQIAWAETIRAEIIERNLEVLGAIKDDGFRQFAKTRLSGLMAEVKAHYWIEKRAALANTEERVYALYEKEQAKNAGLAALKS